MSETAFIDPVTLSYPAWDEAVPLSAADLHALLLHAFKEWCVLDPATDLIAKDIANALRRWYAVPDETSEGAQRYYAECEPLRAGHPYLTERHLDMQGCRGFKVDRLGWLVVPCEHNRNLVSVQRISPVGEARFWPGVSTENLAYRIARKGTAVTVICSDLGSALACYCSIPHSQVVLTFGDAALERARKVKGLKILATGNDWSDWRRERIEAKLQTAGRFQSPTQVRRIVDAELSRELMRTASFEAA